MDEKEGGGADEKKIFLHPLAIVSVSSMYTRIKMSGNEAKVGQRVVGGLLGKLDGREYHIYDIFEFPHEFDGDAIVLDATDFTTHFELAKAVHEDWLLLGWFSIGGDTGKGDMSVDRAIHDQIKAASMCESLLYLILDGEAAQDAVDLPITLYDESSYYMDKFEQANFEMRPDKAEGIAMDHIAKVKAGQEGESQLVSQLNVSVNSLKTLNQRISLLREFLVAAKKGGADHRVLRQVRSVCNRLPTIDSDKFRADFLTEYNDTLLVTYLATITKSAAMVNDVLEKSVTAGVTPRRGLGFPSAFMMHP